VRNRYIIYFCAGMLLFVAAGSLRASLQEKSMEERQLASKYQAFLEEVRPVITESEREAFLRMKTDAERDRFIERFWRNQGEGSGVRSNINTLMMLRMVERLGLTDEQSASLFPLFNRIEREKNRINRMMMRDMFDLRIEAEKGKSDTKRMQELLVSVRELRDALMDKEREMEKIVIRELTIVQQAKYMIFMEDFFRNLRQRLNRARALNRRRR
jgi:hypothetical protein